MRITPKGRPGFRNNRATKHNHLLRWPFFEGCLRVMTSFRINNFVCCEGCGSIFYGRSGSLGRWQRCSVVLCIRTPVSHSLTLSCPDF
jgi:hypothetical protein